MFRSFVLALASVVLAGCASAPPPVAPEPLALNGSLDLSKPGIGIRLADVSEALVCEAHYASGKLPETLSLPLTCSEGRSGTLYLTKAGEALRGTVTLVGGQFGDVTFPPPPPPISTPPAAPAPVAAPVVVPAPSVSYAPPPAHRVYVRHRSSSSGSVYVRAHTRRATYVRPHYRNGRYVSGHHRSGSHVRAHYRRRG
jgi:hypothetical protein